jgi:hypothetical protein
MTTRGSRGSHGVDRAVLRSAETTEQHLARLPGSRAQSRLRCRALAARADDRVLNASFYAASSRHRMGVCVPWVSAFPELCLCLLICYSHFESLCFKIVDVTP